MTQHSSSTLSAVVPKSGELSVRPTRIAWQRTAGRFFRFSAAASAGAIILVALLILILLSPWLMPHDPNAMDLKAKLAAPSADHLFGTDDLGRDILSRTLAGARLSIGVGLAVVFAASLFGTLVGMIGAYFGGYSDQVVMRAADAFLAFPSLILAMALAAAMGAGVVSAAVAIAITSWPKYSRLVRSVVLVTKRTDYVSAAQAIGVQPLGILWRHVLPNSLSPILVQATLDMGAVILLMSGLSFIGFGVKPPTAEWGSMVSTGRNYIITHWWVATIPGLAILVTVIAFNLFGDGLRDWLDPRLRK